MKILYVAPGHYWGSTWPYAFIDLYIVETLKSMGHEVHDFQVFPRANSFIDFYRKIAPEKGWNQAQLISVINDRSMSDLPLEAVHFEPDLILHIVGLIPEKVLKALSKLKIKKACWFLDDPQEIDFTSKKALLYDYVFTVESNCVEYYKNAGSKNAEFLPLGCYPPVQKKMEVEDKYKSDICFVGVPFPRRVEIFDEMADFLKDYNVKIIGGGPSIGSTKDPWLWKRKLKRLDILDKFIVDEIIFPDVTAKYYNGAKINLNIHRASVDDRFAHGNSTQIMPAGVSGRTFEIAGCGGFQLIDEERSNYKVHFKEGSEIIPFKDTAELKKKIEYYISHPKEREEVGDNAQKRAYAEHTYQDRLKHILERSQ